MFLVRPLDLTLNSSSVAASPHAAWNVATNYQAGDKVSYNPTNATIYYEYEALSNHSGETPALGGTEYWLELGPCNRCAMFDDSVSTTTTDTDEIDVTVTPGEYFDHIAILRISGATTVQVVIERSGNTLLDETYSISEDATSWSDYFFGDLSAARETLTIRPSVFFADATAQIIISGPSGSTVGVGLLAIGRAQELGDTLADVSVAIEDYSTKETNDFGSTVLVERDFADRAIAQLILPTAQVDAVRRALARVRATPTLFDLNNSGSDFDSLRIFGFYADFDISLTYDSRSFCRLEVQSLL